ncbi:MAG TPA: c-type cytochrome, partial [Verrucomicrobiae bacterium]
YDKLAQKSGDLDHGKTIFGQTCATCHTVASQGGQIGPVLNGAGAMGTEALLRAVLTPNAAMEAGYRTFRVELKDGDVLDGFLVSQDNEAIVLRQPNAQDRRIPQDDVRRARFTKISMMPEGLLDSLPEKDATDLLAYLKTLK